MELYKAPKFDSWIDGNMTIAQRIVDIFRKSDNFKLRDYDGRDEFYNEYMSKFEEYVDVLKNESEIRDISSYLNVIDNVRDVLCILANNGSLNFTHFLIAYIHVLKYIDVVKDIIKIDDNHVIIENAIYSLFSAESISPSSNVDNIFDIFIRYSEKHPRVVPFTSQTGAFGMNTFLYLYFNNIYPVACSSNPYPVHNNTFEGSINTMGHDYSHLRSYRIMNGTVNEDIGMRRFTNKVVPNMNLFKEYMERIKIIYRMIFNSNLTDGQIKGFIIYLFNYIHERGIIINCNKENEINPGDEIPLLFRNDYYTPERYGFNYDDVREYVINKNKKYLLYTFEYVYKVSDEIHNDFCKRFGSIINIDDFREILNKL